MQHLFILCSIATAGPYESAIPANVDCPFGYTLIGKKCEQNTFQPATVTCSLGQLQGNKCVTTVQPIQTCPIGAQQEGGICKILHYDEPRTECPNGFVLDGAGCVNRKPLQVIEVCEVGRPDGHGGCLNVEVVSKVHKKTCPAGFFDEGAGCAKATTYDCSPNEVIRPQPVFVAAAPVTKQAPTQTVQQALPIFASKKHRMLGAKRSSWGVYSPITVAPVAAPSKGAVTPQIVVQSQPMALVPPSNVAVVKQLCQRFDYAPHLHESFCPQGYAVDGAGCSATSTYPMAKKCVNGNSVDACFEPDVAPVIKHCNAGALVGDKCIAAETIALESVCPAGTDRTGNNCQQFTTPNVSCPPGLTLEGQNCVGKIFADPVGTVTRACNGKECWH